ncbi:MAG TPA: SsrA-binding protein SmpB [Coxiellaceae bacterium]|nr:SsrA-binding protein SmpB [Coxiellaceae bacterium]
MAKKSKKTSENIIADNRKARHDYEILERIEAGMVLAGWEMKSIRDGRAQLKDSYVKFLHGEPYLINAHISPLTSASTHVNADPTRSRKLLLNKKEMDTLRSAVDREGLTLIALNLHWSRHYVKAEIALVRGKKLHDKRRTLKEKALKREQHRFLRS